MPKPIFHTAYEPPAQIDFSNHEPSLTQQHFAEECDINNIVERYLISGVLGDPLASPSAEPMYGDYSSVSDFHAAQNLIAEATQTFDLLPASLRKRFDNDPAKLLAFLEDDSNREEAVKLGLLIDPQSNKQPGSGVSTSTPDSSSPSPVPSPVLS